MELMNSTLIKYWYQQTSDENISRFLTNIRTDITSLLAGLTDVALLSVDCDKLKTQILWQSAAPFWQIVKNDDLSILRGIHQDGSSKCIELATTPASYGMDDNQKYLDDWGKLTIWGIEFNEATQTAYNRTVDGVSQPFAEVFTTHYEQTGNGAGGFYILVTPTTILMVRFDDNGNISNTKLRFDDEPAQYNLSIVAEYQRTQTCWDTPSSGYPAFALINANFCFIGGGGAFLTKARGHDGLMRVQAVGYLAAAGVTPTRWWETQPHDINNNDLRIIGTDGSSRYPIFPLLLINPQLFIDKLGVMLDILIAPIGTFENLQQITIGLNDYMIFVTLSPTGDSHIPILFKI